MSFLRHAPFMATILFFIRCLESQRDLITTSILGLSLCLGCFVGLCGLISDLCNKNTPLTILDFKEIIASLFVAVVITAILPISETWVEVYGYTISVLNAVPLVLLANEEKKY